MKHVISLCTLIIFSVLLLGCGQTGPLYLPASDKPQHHQEQ